ncbi:energy transducer TonB [Neolewinella agarilytica]|uniref:TonB family C-terminal domain-containing protein n=1 Tax=Neolewinella agarilytica TaxID=478744 RepID=A0A1H9DI69_9BACT|nr:energy transducer TonB [Neolewinella agarilytica]SEQ13196.1 TonB family C-terminal domain-containing protein [Neolewinella agarilytica]
MIISKSPYLWLGVSLTCCALALGFIPQMFPATAVSGQDKTTITVELPEQASADFTEDYTEVAGRKVYKTADQMPLFPGRKCGELMKYKKRKACADQAMLQYIYHNVRYPNKAREKGVEGLAVVSFVVEAHGAITEIKVVRDPGAGLGKAVNKVVSKMKKDNIRFEPGIRKGKPVAVQFMLPVKFELKD